jgi:hypothetical protein
MSGHKFHVLTQFWPGQYFFNLFFVVVVVIVITDATV